MALFNIFKKKEAAPVSPTGKYVDKNSLRYELEMKAKAGKPMTAEEHDQLQRYRTRDVWDQVFRIAGVVTVLTIIMLAVFIFLYPYSIFNVFPTSAGKGDVFWKMLNAWHVYVGNDTNTWLGHLGAENNGYVEMGRLFDVAFQSETSRTWINSAGTEILGGPTGFDFKCGVYVIGSWTIVVVATIGFVAAVVGAGFILASNIKNLIGVIRHVTIKTGETFTNLGATAKESYEEAVPEAKEKRKTTRKKKDEKVVTPAEEEPVVLDDTEEEVAKRVEELKEELKEEEVKEQPKVVPVTEAPKAETKKASTKFETLADDDIDRLLGGK